MGQQLKNVIYRKARLEDAPRLVEFQIAMAWETEKMTLDLDNVTQGVAEIFRNPYRGQYFVAESSHSLIGCFLILPEWSDWRNGEVWWIHSLYVESPSRGKGVYKGLYSYLRVAAEEAIKNGIRVRGFRLYVEKTNLAAQEVYRKLGMTDDHYLLFESMLK